VEVWELLTGAALSISLRLSQPRKRWSEKFGQGGVRFLLIEMKRWGPRYNHAGNANISGAFSSRQAWFIKQFYTMIMQPILVFYLKSFSAAARMV
jgi:hypothetical protein